MWGKNNIQIVSVIPSLQSIRNRAPFLPSHVTNTSWHWSKLPGPSQHVPCCLCCGRVCSPTCWRPKDRKGFERWSQLIHQHVQLSQIHFTLDQGRWQHKWKHSPTSTTVVMRWHTDVLFTQQSFGSSWAENIFQTNLSLFCLNHLVLKALEI